MTSVKGIPSSTFFFANEPFWAINTSSEQKKKEKIFEKFFQDNLSWDEGPTKFFYIIIYKLVM